VDPDQRQSVSLGTATPINVGEACQNAYLFFQGTAGHRASVVSTTDGSASALQSYALSILDTDNTTTLASLYFGCASNSSAFVEIDPTKSLMTTSNQYAVLVNPSDIQTGNVSMTVYDVVDISDAIVPAAAMPGNPKSVPVATPGQNVFLGFNTTTAQQRVSLQINDTSQPRVFYPSGFGIYGPDNMPVLPGVWWGFTAG